MSNELKTDSVPDIDAQRNEELDPESVRKRYESMSFDEVTQHMAESYRQLTEVLGKRISTPSAASSDKTTDTPLYDIPDDDDFDDERIVERNDLDDVVKKQKMSKLLARAASSGDVCKVKQLLSDERLRAYIDVDAKDEDGATPLIYAACFGKVEIAQSLLKAGAKTDIQDSSGWSALMWATTNNHEGLVKVLLEYGASAQTRSSRGRTVFDFVNNDNHKIGEILATNPRDSVSSTSSFFGRTTVGSQSSCSSVAGDYDFYYQSTVEGFDNFMVEDAERRQKLMETAMALVGSSQNMDDEADDNEDDDDYKYEDMEEDFDDDDQPNEFHWDKCMPDQMFVFSADDLERILDTAIVNVELPVQSRRDICAPADIVFLSARFAHYFSSDELLHQVLDGALQRIVKITKENARSVHSLGFWLTNIVQLLYYLKKDSGLVVASADYQLRLSEMISEVYTMLINDTERRLYKIIGPAMLEYEQIPGMEDVDFADDWQRFFRRNSRRSIIVPPDGNLSVQMRRHSSQPVHTGTLAPQSVVSVLSSTFYVLQAYEVHPAIIIQALAQFFHFLSCETFNRILTNKKMLSRSKALQIRMNMSYVEDWIRNNRLPSSLLSYLNPTIQLLQLLQCLSQLSDLETFVQTIKKFDSLNALQIRRCVVNYRYEVNEQHLSEDIIYYVTQLADDLVRYKQARKPSKVRRTATTLSRVSSLSMRRSISRPESMSSFMGSIMSSRNSASSMSLPSTPVTENPAAMPSKLASKENETELDDHDIAEIRDSRFMLPFSVPTTAHMVSTNGWAPDNSKDRLVTPAIPESWMEKLDKPTASDDDA